MGKAIIILHLLLCTAVGICFYKRKVASKHYLFPVVALVPFWGFFIFLLEEYYERGQQKKLMEIGLDTLKIQEVRYQPIEMDERKNQEITVPLEEAMIVNDASITRRLMKDILHKNPDKYIELLQTARSTEDTELAHYATTTMLEVQARYEKAISDWLHEWKRHPQNMELLRKCHRELTNYVDSNLLTGKILDIYRKQLDEVLQKLCESEPTNRKYVTHFIENRMALQLYEGLEEKIDSLMENAPEDERVYQVAVDYYWHTGQGDKIKEILYHVEHNHIYLTSTGKKWYDFWRQDGYENE